MHFEPHHDVRRMCLGIAYQRCTVVFHCILALNYPIPADFSKIEQMIQTQILTVLSVYLYKESISLPERHMTLIRIVNTPEITGGWQLIRVIY